MRVTGPGASVVPPKISERSRVAAPAAVDGAAELARPSAVVAPKAAEIAGRAERSEVASAAHVQSLKAAVQNGTYKVEPKQVAERLVDEELARAGSR